MNCFNLNRNVLEVRTLIDNNFYGFKIVKISEFKKGFIKKYKTDRKTKFTCYCENTWTTARSLYVFNFSKSPKLLNLVLYNQKCKICNSKATNYSLYLDIFEEFTDFIIKKLSQSSLTSKVHFKDKTSKMKDVHDKARCIACLNGLH